MLKFIVSIAERMEYIYWTLRDQRILESYLKPLEGCVKGFNSEKYKILEFF